MEFKKSIALGLIIAAIPLVSCGTSSSSSSSSTKTSTASSSSSSSQGSSSSTSIDDGIDPEDTTKKVTLGMSVMYQKLNTRMKFYADQDVELPYNGADGVQYEAGDFKPVWRSLQKKLNFTIDDKTSISDFKIADAFGSYQRANFAGLNIAQGSSSDIIKEGTTNKTILDLSKYLDKMPNFKAFLDSKPVIAKTIVDGNGAMYYAPYFDGLDDIERMLLVRHDWVEKLLDGDLPATLDTAKTITAAYTAYTPEIINATIKVLNDDETGTGTVVKNHKANIITKQNAGTMNGKNLVINLRDYIDSTYGTAYGTKRSSLFLGGKAAYDVDELVALYRCVVTNPQFLTGNADNNLVAFYPRESTNDRTADLWRFMQFFGVRGGESRNGYLYVGDDGKIHDARMEAKTVTALGKLHEMYEEGLILENFNATTVNKGKFEQYLQKNNLGFSTYDYNQTQTVYNDVDNAYHPTDVEGFRFAAALPAVADWRGDGNYFHYTESWRSVKSEGWFITAATANDKALLSRALKLFDYLYSEEGNRLMSFGPDGYLAKNADESIKYMDYQGTQVPVLSNNCKSELKTLAAGNYTNYYRYWLGATYPVGYIKQQGMEYQTVSTAAVPALDTINHAIQYGVLEHVNFKTDNTDHLYDIIPTTLSFTSSEQTNLSASFTDLDTAINNTKGKTNIWSTIVMEGFGTIGGVDYSEANYLNTVSTVLNCTGYVKIYNDAYARMGL